jgi:Trk K+ transport system NAD-binding subunit
MSDILLITLRRMRAPIIVLIVVYAISVIGLTQMPGVDPEGRPWRMSFFDAFYVMSYTATTIGFGEIPYPFSYEQRAWMTLSIYLTVIGWAYTLGSIFALVNTPAFRHAFARSRFESRVRQMGEPFYVICGYGQSGRRLVRALDELGYGTVIVESDPERARPHLLRDTRNPSVLLVADARATEVLRASGVAHPQCAGVLALTGSDEANQAIAIGVKVLSRDLAVLARAIAPAVRETLEAFGGVVIVDPYEAFAYNFGVALAKPDNLRLEDWLTGVPGTKPPRRIEAPRGHWVVAGHGRFGAALGEALAGIGLSWTAIDLKPERCGEAGVQGSALIEANLRAAGIEHACGLIAGTDSDSNNLAVVNAARRLQKKLFVVVRQNHADNRSLVEAARPDMEFVQSQVMTHECVQLLTTPLLNRFLMRARHQPAVWAVGVLGRLRDTVGDTVPHTWAVTCDPAKLGVRYALVEAPTPPFTVAHLLMDPDDRRKHLPAVPLLLLASGRELLLPDEHTALHEGDRVLFAGAAGIEGLQRRILNDDSTVHYLRTGREPAHTWLGRLLEARRAEADRSPA